MESVAIAFEHPQTLCSKTPIMLPERPYSNQNLRTVFVTSLGGSASSCAWQGLRRPLCGPKRPRKRPEMFQLLDFMCSVFRGSKPHRGKQWVLSCGSQVRSPAASHLLRSLIVVYSADRVCGPSPLHRSSTSTEFALIHRASTFTSSSSARLRTRRRKQYASEA